MSLRTKWHHLFLWVWCACIAGETFGESLTAGKAGLTVVAENQNRMPVSIALRREAGGSFTFSATEPCAIQLLDRSGATNWLVSRYSSVQRVAESLRCQGEIRSPSGTLFRFMDLFTPAKQGDAFELAREVTVESPSANDVGFLSCFRLHLDGPHLLREQEIFMPGVWYLDNRHVPPRALAANLSDEVFLIREARLPLPLVMLRNKTGLETLTLVHLHPNGSTCLADYAPGRVIDSRIQVASLGVFARPDLAAAICYPATEGERTYLRKRVPGDGPWQSKAWAERFHPVRPGVPHSYKVLIDISEQPDFPQAMSHAWRRAFEAMPPPIVKTELAAVYEASIKLLTDWSRSYDGGSAGLPFRLKLPRGELEGKEHINFQMGFVGQQLPLAGHLLRYGLLNQQAAVARKGEAMVDFWAANSLTAEGLPRTWYDVYPQPHWRPYNTYLRIASDGMVGALKAWDVMQCYDRSKPQWLTFCRSFGDWLVRHQNSDGSWFREYDWAGQPVHTGKHNTSHPIPFLIDLYQATGEQDYLQAARRAGDWCFPQIHQAFAYVGGTADNPNVLDKEAGFLALDAFLALHDVTGEPRWLQAAAQAANFTETWVYCWNIPIPAEDQQATFPKGASTVGLSLIATGHSGSDLYLAGAPFLYYRLYLATGDTHFAEMASLLLYDTRQLVDINGSLGYGHTGLCSEAMSLAPPRGHGVNTWLPWLTYSMIEPIVNLREAYGVADTPVLGGAALENLRSQDREFGKTRGLFSGKRSHDPKIDKPY